MLLIQFELSIEQLSSRLRKQMETFPEIPKEYLKIVCFDDEDKLFISQWEKIKDTITENKMATAMWRIGAMGAIHRFMSIEDSVTPLILFSKPSILQFNIELSSFIDFEVDIIQSYMLLIR